MIREFMLSDLGFTIGIICVLVLGVAATWGVWRTPQDKPAPTLREQIQTAKLKGRWK